MGWQAREERAGTNRNKGKLVERQAILTKKQRTTMTLKNNGKPMRGPGGGEKVKDGVKKVK